MYRFRSVWPGAVENGGDDNDANDDSVCFDIRVDDSCSDSDVNFDMEVFENGDSPLSSVNGDDDDVPDYVSGLDSPVDMVDDNADLSELNISQPSQHHHDRSWASWGNVSNENILPIHRNHRYGRGLPRDRHEPGWERLVKQCEGKR